MMKLLKIFLIVLVFSWTNQAKAQCPFNNTFYVDLTPAGVGMTASDLCVWSGDLITVNVVAGETYIFSLCNNFGFDDSYLTLYNTAGTVVLDFNDDFCGLYSQITWVATYTGVVNLLVDDFGCTSNTNCMQLDVTWLGAGPCTALPLDPICTSTGLSFAAGTTGTDATMTDPTNNWDCLLSAPDAEFFYLEISAAGNINMTLSAPSDIDFVIWGPYADLPTAESLCGQWGTGGANGTVIDCSFLGAATEYPDIIGAQVGEVYVMAITNFSGLPQTLSLTQTGGTGATDCSIVCGADVGTFTITENGSPATSPIYLCESGGGDCFSIVSNNDFVLPPAVAGEAAEIMYAIYTCAPNVAVAPDLDPCYSGFLWTGQDISDCNNAGSIFLGAGLGPTVYLVPITMDDGDNNGNPNGAIHWDNSGDACFDMGTPVQITWLNQTAWSGSMDPCTGTASITITGGLPEFDASNYTVTNTGPGTLGGTPVTHNGTVTISNLLNGETVTLDITDGEGCVVSVSYGPVTVTQPSLNNPGPLNGCDNVTLPAISGTNLNSPAYYTGSGGTGTMYAAGVAVSTSGTYYVYDNAGGCWDEESFLVTVSPTPVITNPGPLSGCDNVVLPAFAGSNLTAGVSYYDGPGGTGNAYAAGASITTGGTYYIYDNTGAPNNCSDEISFNITVTPTPVITNPGPLLGCDNVTLPAFAGTNLTAGVSYYDGPGGTGNAYAAGTSITTSGTYYIYDNTGAPDNCSDEESFVVTVTPTPIITNPGTLVGCDSVQLPAIAGSNLTAGVAYYDGAGGTGNMYAAGDWLFTSGTYYIYDNTGAPNNCSDEESFTVTVTAGPVIDPVADQIACASFDLLPITGTGLSGNQGYYDDSQLNGGQPIIGPITSSQTVWMIDSVGTCTFESSYAITINVLPTVTNISGGSTYCAGEVAADILVDATGNPDWTVYYTLDGTPQTTTGSTSPINLGNAAGVYVLDSIADINCSNTASGTETIIVNPIPAAPTAGTDTEYCSGDVFNDMTASGGNGVFNWYSDPSLTDLLGAGPTYLPADTEGILSYYVTETENNCEGPASEVIITVNICKIVVPTAFTPNNDGKHDDWEIYNLDLVYPNSQVRVFNRWGNLVYESTPGAYDSNRWDGTYQGELLPVGSYYYIIELNNAENGSEKGTVSIIHNN